MGISLMQTNRVPKQSMVDPVSGNVFDERNVTNINAIGSRRM